MRKTVSSARPIQPPHGFAFVYYSNAHPATFTPTARSRQQRKITPFLLKTPATQRTSMSLGVLFSLMFPLWIALDKSVQGTTSQRENPYFLFLPLLPFFTLSTFFPPSAISHMTKCYLYTPYCLFTVIRAICSSSLQCWAHLAKQGFGWERPSEKWHSVPGSCEYRHRLVPH